jgi:hypothetical protein
MNFIYSVFRLLSVGNPNPRQLAIRAVGLGVLILVAVIWGINYRNSLPPSGIRGDTSPTLSPLTDAGTLEVGGSVTGSLADGERHTWAFEGAAGQRVNIRVRGDWDSTLALLPPNGSQSIAGDFNSGGGWQAFMCNQLLRTAGTYRIVVSGELGLPDKNFGDYTLTIEEETYIEERPLAYGETVEGRLTTCDGDFYTVAVEQGDRLEVTLTPENGAKMYIRLLSSRTDDETIYYGQDTIAEDGRPQQVIAVDVRQNATIFIHVDVPIDEPEAAYSLSIGHYIEATQEATGEATPDV